MKPDHAGRFVWQSAGLTLLLVTTLLVGTAPLAAQDSQDGTVVVFLVRHAEKTDDSQDATLSIAGQIRAQSLVQLFGDAGLTRVHSTDYRRTRETARPVSDEVGLDVELYDPRELDAFAEQLKTSPGRHLVVGHSNTTPGLVSALGGNPHGTIHDLEYDRLYVVTIAPGTEPVTVLMRFGEPYEAGNDFGMRSTSTRPRAMPGTALVRARRGSGS